MHGGSKTAKAPRTAGSEAGQKMSEVFNFNLERMCLVARLGD